MGCLKIYGFYLFKSKLYAQPPPIIQPPPMVTQHDYHTLPYKYRIGNMQTKINRSIYAINFVKNVLPNYTLRTFYQTLIESHLNYGIKIWGNSIHYRKLQKDKRR